MTKKVVISTAAVPQEFERRLVMASRLLAASEFEVTLQPWDGSRHELLVADIDDAYGRAAVNVAARRGDTILRLSHDRAGAVVAHDVQIAELTHVLRKSLGEMPATKNGHAHPRGVHQPGGLLDVWQAPWRGGEDFAAVSGAFTLVVRRKQSRVVARSHADLAAARTRFTRETWTITTDALHMDAGAGDLWQSVDAFLIESCVANENDLPPLEGAFRLDAWPDTGTLHDGEDLLRIAAALTKRTHTVAELALRCRVGNARANAFCWAASAGGLLAAQSANAKEPRKREAAAPGALSIVARLARRFGLNFG